MKKQQSGFTLIELVVVIVILGILAATAVPRFANLTTNANTAVAQGLLGSIMSSAAIQLGNNLGTPSSFANVLGNTDFANVPSGTTLNAAGGDSGGGPMTIDATGTNFTGGPITCDTTGVGTTITVAVSTQSAAGTLSGGLCSG